MVEVAKGIEAVADIVLNKIVECVNSQIENHSWKKLFVQTGDFLADSTDSSTAFENDLKAVFSDDNMHKIAKNIKEKNGFEIVEALREELYQLFSSYEIETGDAQTYIHYFIEIILSYISKEDHDKYLEVYLNNWRQSEEKNFEGIQRQYESIKKILSVLADKEKKSIKTYTDIDAEIRRRAKDNRLSLDFFEVDDEECEGKLRNSIDKEVISVVGKSKEETLYRLLRWLKDNYQDRIILTVLSENAWDALRDEEVTGRILIPFFRADVIKAIPGNHVIFIYSEEEPCYDREKIVMHRRTRRNLVDALEKIGMNHQKAFILCEDTHGLYTPMIRRLFKDGLFKTPEWSKNCDKAVLTALLCGKWTESDGDKLIIEMLSGLKYQEYEQRMLRLSRGDTPFILRNTTYGSVSWQLASVEDAWEEVDQYIDDDFWNEFIDLFYEVLIETEPLFDYPFEKHFAASIYAQKPQWSRTLKHGMIRTLIMRAYYRKHEEKQGQVDSVVKRVLDTINTKEQWGYIAQFITDLCEASPKAVMDKLDESIKNDTGIIDFFSANDGGFLMGRNYYTNVLWAIEQLLFQKQYTQRAVEWLWKLDSFNIEYKISNSPRSTIEEVFCAWVNLTAVNTKEKIKYAEMAFKKYSNAWDIFFGLLPGKRTSICASLSKPKYRDVCDPEVLNMDDVNKIYLKYYELCISHIGNDVGRWLKMIPAIDKYSKDIITSFFEYLLGYCDNSSDENRVRVKNKLREEIHRHRKFGNAEWAMKEDVMNLFEVAMNSIMVSNYVYDYLYLFENRYNFPLLNPEPFDKEETSNRDINAERRSQEITSRMEEFKKNKYSLEELVKLACDYGYSEIGTVLAEFYSKDGFDEDVYDLLLSDDTREKYAYDYAKFFVANGRGYLNEIIRITRERVSNEQLLVKLISLEVIESPNCIIANETESIKKRYWQSGIYSMSIKAEHDTYTWALGECYRYGTAGALLALLFDAKEKLTPEDIYDYIFGIENMESCAGGQLSDYYLEELLKIIQAEYINIPDSCEKIAMLEWRCRNVLNWDQMVCLQKVMKSNPNFYGDLVMFLYKTDDGKTDEEKSKIANKIYDGFHKAKFCPTEKNGNVDYDEFIFWVDGFKKILKNHNQSSLFGHLMGRLLPNAPKGQDGVIPCEAVRQYIEENLTDDMKSSFIVEEENKRGVYVVDGGRTEKNLSNTYKAMGDDLVRVGAPRTAEIYYEIGNHYNSMAQMERKRAEDEW